MERRRRGAAAGGPSPERATPARTGGRDRQYTQSVGRALAILQAFRPTRPSIALTELARAVDLDKATVRRLLDLGRPWPTATRWPWERAMIMVGNELRYETVHAKETP